MRPVRIALAPDRADYAASAVVAAGGVVVEPTQSPDALVWTAPGSVDRLGPTLQACGPVRWVQLPMAGVEDVAGTGVLTDAVQWTCAKGVYSEPVAEHALALTLAALRALGRHARARDWGGQAAQTLYDQPVTIIGGGGVAEALLALLAPFRCVTTVVRRNGSRPVGGAGATFGPDRLHDALESARVVILALALTPQTDGMLGAAELARMRPDAVLVNVARGRHVDTDSLVRALRAGRISGAALDVTDPEPLPPGHPLWTRRAA